MARIVQLSNHFHRSLTIKKTIDESVSALNMVPVMLSEFQKLIVNFPIALTKNKETGKFVCVALMGLEHGENLFWENQQWLGLYTPLNIARLPFCVGKDSASGDDEFAVCINLDSSSVASESEGEQLFNESGADSDRLSKVKGILSELLVGEEETNNFVSVLLKFNVLAPVSLEVTLRNANTQSVRGLYSIDEEKLNALTAAEMTELHEQKYLFPIHMMMASMGQFYALIDKKNQQEKTADSWFEETV